MILRRGCIQVVGDLSEHDGLAGGYFGYSDSCFVSSGRGGYSGFDCYENVDDCWSYLSYWDSGWRNFGEVAGFAGDDY